MTDQPQTTAPTNLPARIRDVIAHGGTLSDSTALRAADEIERLRTALKTVASVEKEIRLMAYTSAGDPKLMNDMKMYAIWAGTLQSALAPESDAL